MNGDVTNAAASLPLWPSATVTIASIRDHPPSVCTRWWANGAICWDYTYTIAVISWAGSEAGVLCKSQAAR